MRQATSEEELKVIKSMIKSRLEKQGKKATEEQIEQMANRILQESDEKIMCLEENPKTEGQG